VADAAIIGSLGRTDMRIDALRVGAMLAMACALLGVALPSGARAETWPERPFKFFVPFPAGGSSDAVARAMQPALEKVLGQPVVVENRAGAGGMLGVDAVAKAAPDGYTVGLAGAGALGVNIGERTKRPYDPAKDLTPISRAAESPFILVATPSFKAATLGDVIKLAKAEPNSVTIGHGGNGTAMHLAALMLVSMADIKINLVPYRGTAPAVTDAIAGHVQLAIADPPPSMGAISEGKLKAIAVSSKRRSAVFPDVPTFDELGLKDFELTAWLGIVAPGGTPRDIVAKLNAAMVAALKDPEVGRRIRTFGMEPTPTSPEGLAAYLEGDIAKAAKVQIPPEKPN
jgi:tripartite-type tricarboxylate transporter receptor subunit TctC